MNVYHIIPMYVVSAAERWRSETDPNAICPLPKIEWGCGLVVCHTASTHGVVPVCRRVPRSAGWPSYVQVPSASAGWNVVKRVSGAPRSAGASQRM
jgi:hypothetical protein